MKTKRITRVLAVLLAVVLMATLAIFAVGCNGDEISVSVNPTTHTLTAVGQTVTITPTVTGTENTEVTWTNNNPAAVSVVNGVVTAIANGTAVITATSVADTARSASATITVNIGGQQQVAVTSVELTSPVTQVTQGGSVQLGLTVLPANATNRAVNWTVVPAGAATVSATGAVTIATTATGDVTITATSVSAPTLSDSVTIEVTSVDDLPAGAIATAAQFNAITSITGWQDMNFFLVNDINFGGGELTPIGGTDLIGDPSDPSATQPNTFRGVFDGRGHALRNFTLTGDGWHMGVFRNLFNAKVRNLTIANATMDTGGGASGAILASRTAGQTIIENVSIVNSTVSGSGGYLYQHNAGFIAGIGAGVIVRNVVVSVQGANYALAHRVLTAPANISNVFIVDNAHGAVSGTHWGGAALPAGTVNFIAPAAVATTDFSNLSDDYWSFPAGQLPVLRNQAGIPNFDGLRITATNNATGDSFTVSGFPSFAWAGENLSFTVTRLAGFDGVPSVTIQGRPDPIVGIGDGPNFVITVTNVQSNVVVTGVTGFTASQADFEYVPGRPGAFGITTADQFLNMSNFLDGEFVLLNNIDFTGVSFAPIAPSSAAMPAVGISFSGELDGAGHTISNIVVPVDGHHMGIFGSLNTATVHNLHIDNATVNAVGQSGILAGSIISSTVENILITNSNIVGEYAGQNWFAWAVNAGLAGHVRGANTIRNIVMSVSSPNTRNRLLAGFNGNTNPWENIFIVTDGMPDRGTYPQGPTGSDAQGLFASPVYTPTGSGATAAEVDVTQNGSTIHRFAMADITTVDFSTLGAAWNTSGTGLPTLV